MRRRTFLKKTLAGTMVLGAGTLSFKAAEIPPAMLTILHTNDLHGRTGVLATGLREAVEAVRAENPNLLCFDAGDFSPRAAGSVPARALAEWMRTVGYDAVTFGAREYSNAPELLLQQFNYVNIPVVPKDIGVSLPKDESTLAGECILERAGIRIGVIGVGGELEEKNAQLSDILDFVDQSAARLKEVFNCKLVICLSRLGFCYSDGRASDLLLAAASRHIQVILGGATHTYLQEAEQCTNADGAPVWVSHAGAGGCLLGRLDLWVFPDGQVRLAGSRYLPVASVGV
jgi:5'-nucleotidase